MRKPFAKVTILVFFISILVACQGDIFDIIPIDKELNARLWSLEGMDQRLFDTNRRLQYFEVSRHKNLKYSVLGDSLTDFIDKNYPLKKVAAFKEVGFFFYQKSAFNNYNDKVFLAARDSEYGLIEGHTDMLIGQVWFTKLAENALLRRTLIFDGHSAVLNHQDTIHIDVETKQMKVKVSTQ